MFNSTIVRKPAESLVNGITSNPTLGKPNYELALQQHAHYVNALKEAGTNVTILNQLEEFPDSCFVEDVAVLTDEFAIITNPGIDSRENETAYIKDTINSHYQEEHIHIISGTSTIDGGDVMQIEKTFYIGESDRTNQAGIADFKKIIESYGYQLIIVALEEMLHLKTGVNYLGDNNLLITGEFLGKEEFRNFNQVEIPEAEAYAANCIRVNEFVIVPEGYPVTLNAVKQLGYPTITVDTSEFKKLDGGLSCLSLRFNSQKQ